jgi:hypothetical protein
MPAKMASGYDSLMAGVNLAKWRYTRICGARRYLGANASSKPARIRPKAVARMSLQRQGRSPVYKQCKILVR